MVMQESDHWKPWIPVLSLPFMDNMQHERRKTVHWTGLISAALLLLVIAIIINSGPFFSAASGSPVLLVGSEKQLRTRVSRPAYQLKGNVSWSAVCLNASAEEDGFLSHCEIPGGEPREKMGNYVGQRMEHYTGSCNGDALRFHCLEYAARQRGWCDWSKVPDAQPIPPQSFVNRYVCESLVERPPVFDNEGTDGHKIIFFYPSYGHLEMLKRSITALQHPNHIFLIQVDETGADEAFVNGVIAFANTADNICVARHSYVLYLTASQVLVMWPALAWAEGIKGWTHFFLMGAQTYPIIPLTQLRNICRENPEENFFSFSLHTKYARANGSSMRRYTEFLPYCRKNGSNEPEVPRRLGGWIDEDGTTRGPKQRIDWLEIQLGKPWELGKSPGVEVLGASRSLVSFLVHVPGAKMFKQFFTYMGIACEHLVPSIVKHYLPHTFTDRNACYMAWKGTTKNKVLEPDEWPLFTDPDMKYLFARKFVIPGSEELLARVDKELRNIDVSSRRH